MKAIFQEHAPATVRPHIIGTVATADGQPLSLRREREDGDTILLVSEGPARLYAWSDGLITWTPERELHP